MSNLHRFLKQRMKVVISNTLLKHRCVRGWSITNRKKEITERIREKEEEEEEEKKE